MALIRVQIPLGGKSETAPFSAQEPYTYREGKNIRSQDPGTGRMRLSKRPGLTDYNSSALNGAVKVSDLAHVTYDNRKVTYTKHGDGDEEVLWGKKTPSGEDSVGGAVDPRTGDVLVLDGKSSIIAFNPDGAEVYRFVFPVADDKNVIRTIAVDDFGCVFAGVSEGGLQRTARIWKYEPDPEEVSPLKQVFELELDAFCERIRVVGDKFYVALNMPDRARSFIRAYSIIGRLAVESFSAEVSFPVNDLDVRDDGSFAVASPEFGTDATTFLRGPNPRAADYSPVVVNWTPRDDEDLRIWSWYDATMITDLDMVGGILEEGAELRIWRDVSGNERHFYEDPEHGELPTFTFSGVADRPSVRFAYDGTTAQGLKTLSNFGITQATADKQRSAIPGYTGCMYAGFMVLLPQSGSTNSRFGLPLYQRNDTLSDHEFIAVNRQADTNQADGYRAGSVSYNNDNTDSGYDPHGPGSEQPISGDFATPTGAIIVAWISDGGIDPTGDDDSTTRSVFYIDGDVLDRWETESRTSSGSTFMGGNLSDLNAGSEGYNGLIAELIVLDRVDRDDDSTEPKILTHDFYGTEPGTRDAVDGPYSANQFNRIVGYLAHKWGLAKQLPTDAVTRSHPYGEVNGAVFPQFGPPGLDAATDGISGPYAQLISRFPLTAKFGSSGELLWVYNQVTSNEAAADQGGVGYGVLFGTDDDLFCMGPSRTNQLPLSQCFLRKLIDNGSSFSDARADGAWHAIAATTGENIDYGYPRMDVDEFGNVYAPIYETAVTAASLRVYDKTGSAGDGVLLVDYLLPNDKLGTAVLIDPRVPDYTDNATTVDIAENVYIFSTNEGNSLRAVITKLQLVEVTARTGASRSMILVGVAGGAIKTITTSAIGTPSGSPTLSASADYIQSVVAFERVYFTDGIRYRVYDPVEDSVSTWESTRSSSIPKRCRLIELWRGRVFLAGDPENRHDWHLGRIGEPNDFNEYPADITPDQAISGTNPFNGPGTCPDLINAFVPVNEDIAIFGGDHTLHLLAGDPMQGGSIDLLSDITGMAFGRPWCKDPEGRVYFMGSRGGLYTWAPGGGVERLSLYRLERELSEIDLATYYWRLAYDARQEGIIMSIFPFGAGETLHDGWFYDLKTGRILGDSVFHVDSWASTTLQPTAMVVIDGDDPDDRRVVVGCEDGKVRLVDETNVNDGTTGRIDAFVTLGPLAVPSQTEFLLTRLEIQLADDLAGTIFQIFSTDDPDVLGTPVDQGTLRAGFNIVHVRARGAFLYLRLRNAQAGQTFSVESVMVNLEPAGRRLVYTP